MKKLLVVITVFVSTSAFAAELCGQLQTINDCTAAADKCLAMQDDSGDSISLSGKVANLAQKNSPEMICLQGEFTSEDKFVVSQIEDMLCGQLQKMNGCTAGLEKCLGLEDAGGDMISLSGDIDDLPRHLSKNMCVFGQQISEQNFSVVSAKEK